MTGEKEMLSFERWASPLSPAEVFARPPAPVFPQLNGSALYWLEPRATEGGRLVLVREEAAGNRCVLTPQGYSIRSRVYEMGGRAYVMSGELVYFVNESDQRIYCQSLIDGTMPVAITRAHSDGRWMYADLQLTADARFLLFVLEEEVEGRENRNFIAYIPLGGMGRAEGEEPRILVSGSDFYGCFSLSPDDNMLAWIEWDHPNMPWDDTSLFTASCDAGENGIAIGKGSRIDGGDSVCICQCLYVDDDRLVYSRDTSAPTSEADEYWNLYLYEAGISRAITAELEEFGGPNWILGDARFTAIPGPGGATEILAVATVESGQKLYRIDPASGDIRQVSSEYTAFSQLGSGTDGEAVSMVAAGEIQPATSCVFTIDGGLKLRRKADLPLAGASISRPRHFAFEARAGGEARAWFYPPAHESYIGPVGERPPMLVMAHGGPTGRTSGVFDLLGQFWCGNGFALLDVDYRGSTGYGRRYRDALLGTWGELDMTDIVDAVSFVTGRGWAHPEKVFIRGKSAGGYTVLRSMTEFPDIFAAGACYYGIGNLSTLAAVTHKFERHYLDRLLGEEFIAGRANRPDNVYYRRSPVNFMQYLTSPVILFQGLDDRIVPPAVSREVAALLSEKGISHQYIEYHGEGHGFRMLETNSDALKRELKFFREVLCKL